MTIDDLPFGGKVFILLGDFRQTCPVIPGGSHAQIIDACIQSSPLWKNFSLRHLTHLIRNAEDPEYAHFVNSIGDGTGPEILLNILSHTTEKEELINFVFPDSVLLNPLICIARGILALTNKQVDDYNAIILERIDGKCKQYLAADSIKEVTETGLLSDENVLYYASCQMLPGLPPFCLDVKTNTVFRIL